ncbi:hypothetical protein GQ54DRAFT_314788 [Martensiomyces pterosporus]|nr:hypothetical protein GQ54DRAFT_314788 [Martensiomyces pterosporus]
MSFTMCERDTLFQVPPDIGCANLHSLFLGVNVSFQSMLRLLSNLKHLVELVLNVYYGDIDRHHNRRVDPGGYVDELQPAQANYQPVSNTLRRFGCRLYSPWVRRCYTTSYALELALHLPALECMVLSVDDPYAAATIKALLGRFLEGLSGSPYMSVGLLNAKVVKGSHILWHRYFDYLYSAVV